MAHIEMDIVNETVAEESMDMEEYHERIMFVENNRALDVTSRQSRDAENSRNDIGKNGSSELLDTVTQETQLDQESSAGIDTDEQEVDEDDITSKLLSIQVLPRIPKRKPVTGDSVTTSAGETSSYCSVLERVNSAPSSAGARSNWSAAGWSRSNIDRPLKRWSQKGTKDKKAESKPVKRTASEKHQKSDAKQKAEVTKNKSKQVTEHSAWSPDAEDVSGCPSFSEIEQISADESTASTATGPLPTLPFEEQMRERARLRKLKQGGFDVENDSSDAAETMLKNFDSSENNSKDGFDSASLPSFRTEKTATGKPVISKAKPDAKMPFFANSTALLQHTGSAERRRSSQHHLSENGHSHDHKAIKPNRRTSRSSDEDKANRPNFTKIRDSKPAKSIGDEPVPKSKKEPNSPPLPHLPVLPLFATSVPETSDAVSHRLQNKTATLRKKTGALTSSSQSVSAVNDSRDISSSDVPRLKPSTSATTSAKSVSFNCSAKSQGGGEIKRKSKPKVGFNHTNCFFIDLAPNVVNPTRVFSMYSLVTVYGS